MIGKKIFGIWHERAFKGEIVDMVPVAKSDEFQINIQTPFSTFSIFVYQLGEYWFGEYGMCMMRGEHV